MYDVLSAAAEPETSDWPPVFTCDSAQSGSAACVTVSGELDIATVPRLDEALRRAAATVVLDLRRLEFIDCSGMHLLIAADRRARRSGGRLIVVPGAIDIDWIFSLVGVDHRLELVGAPPAGLDAHRALAAATTFPQ